MDKWASTTSIKIPRIGKLWWRQQESSIVTIVHFTWWLFFSAEKFQEMISRMLRCSYKFATNSIDDKLS